MSLADEIAFYKKLLLLYYFENFKPPVITFHFCFFLNELSEAYYSLKFFALLGAEFRELLLSKWLETETYLGFFKSFRSQTRMLRYIIYDLTFALSYSRCCIYYFAVNSFSLCDLTLIKKIYI